LMSSVVPSDGGILDTIKGFGRKIAEKVGLPGYCKYECKNGHTPRQNPAHVGIRRTNGCGSLGVDISSILGLAADFTACCNEHDVCYDQCNAGRTNCDNKLFDCLKRYCNGPKRAQLGCNNLNRVGSLILKSPAGCIAYRKAQEWGCNC